MMRWQFRYLRVAIVLGAFLALMISAGAGMRWTG
jgi:hypothetical protein